MIENEKVQYLQISMDGSPPTPAVLEERYPPTLWESLSSERITKDHFYYFPIGFPLSETADPTIPQCERKINISNILTSSELRALFGKILWIIAAPGTGKTQWVMDIVLQMGLPTLYITHRSLANRQFKQRTIDMINGQDFSAMYRPEILDLTFTTETSRTFSKYDITAVTYQKVAESFDKKTLPAKNPKIIIIDEVHALWSDAGFNSKTSNVIEGLIRKYPSALVICMTGTPQVALGNFMTWMHNNNFSKDVYCYNFYENPDTNSIAVFFRDDEELINIIRKAPSNEKYLIFHESINEGETLTNKLQNALGQENVEFLCAKNMRDGSQEEIIQDIIQRAQFDKRVLIATPVLDAAVSLMDKDLRNLVFFSCDPVRIKQEKGRKRRENTEQINLYFCIPTQKALNGRIQNIREKLNTALNTNEKVRNGVRIPSDKLPFPMYMEVSQPPYRYNQFTIDQWRWEIRQNDEALTTLKNLGEFGYAEMLLRKLNITDRSWLNNNRSSLNENLNRYREKVKDKLNPIINCPQTGEEGEKLLAWVSDVIWEIPDDIYQATNITKGKKGDGKSPQGFRKLISLLELEYRLEHRTVKQCGEECWIVRQGKEER